MADVALVQKVGYADESLCNIGETTVRSMAALSVLPHFSAVSPFTFLSGRSIWPSSGGYSGVGSDATVYRFENIVMDKKGEAMDSTLLLVFDIVNMQNGRMEDYYSPESQAIVVSGDVDAGKILEKMTMLSMMVTKTGAEPAAQKQYEWKDEDGPAVSIESGHELSTVTATYRFQRTARSDMATVLPLVTSRYITELQVLIRKRLEQALRSGDVPFASIDFDYLSGAVQPGDEKFSITVSTGQEHTEKVIGILAGVLGSIDRDGCSPDEYKDITGEVLPMMEKRYGRVMVANAGYVDRCIGNFLYGSSLASVSDELNFFLGRQLDDASASRLFGNFASAILDRNRNLSISCETAQPLLTRQGVRDLFESSWTAGDGGAKHISWRDTVSLRRSPHKAKLRNTAAEPMFGGQIWTFSNGIRVIFCKAGDGGMFHYSWIVDGGFYNIAGLDEGESAYVGDMLGLYKVAGMSGRRFSDMLKANGIEMDAEVSVSEFSLGGTAPDRKLPLLLKAVAAMGYDRSAADRDEYDYYRRCEKLRRMAEDRAPAVLDSMMTGGVEFSTVKRTVRLSDDLPRKVSRYYDGVFGRMNGGALIIVGDMNSEDLKKTLSQYLGTFKTSDASVFRSRSNGGRLSGRRTVSRISDRPGIGIALSAPINYTTENYVAANIAAVAMGNAVSKAVATEGWRVDPNWTVSMFPDESLQLKMYLSRADYLGLPASMVSQDSSGIVLSKAREAISRFGSRGIPADRLAEGRDHAKNSFESMVRDPEVMTRLLSLRYSFGKDLVSGFASRAAQVDASRVNGIISSLASGGIAEYVVYDRNAGHFEEIPVRDKFKVDVPSMEPASGNFVYPLDGMKVPFDTVDIRDIVVRIAEPDTVRSLTMPDSTVLRIYDDFAEEIAGEIAEEIISASR